MLLSPMVLTPHQTVSEVIKLVYILYSLFLLFTHDKIYLTVLRFKFKQGLHLTIV